MILGADISHHQGNPNFNLVKASGIQFVILKATEGVNYVDPCFHTNANNALAVGLKVGAYHFLRATPIDQQCNDFIAAIKQHNINWYVAIDVENPSTTNTEVSALGKTEITNRILYFANRLRAAGYKNILCYSNHPWFTNYIDLAKVKADGIRIWYARYSNANPGNTDYSSICDIWQYASDGNVQGISGNVDMNVCYRDIDNNISVDVVCDAPKLNLVEGNTYQYRITAPIQPNVVIANSNIIQLRYVSNSGNDYFYKVTALGNAGDCVGLYANGKRISVITVTKPYCDTYGPFKIRQNSTYQFKSDTSKIICGNGKVGIQISQIFSNGFYFTKFRLIGKVGDRVGFYYGNSKVAGSVCEVI